MRKRNLRISENKCIKTIGMLTTGCCEQDVVRQFNVHPFAIRLLLSCFRVAWQVSDYQRHRRPRKTTIRSDQFILTTLRSNRFMHVCTQSCQWLTSVTGCLCRLKISQLLLGFGTRHLLQLSKDDDIDEDMDTNTNIRPCNDNITIINNKIQYCYF
jgi:hypothetical protein